MEPADMPSQSNPEPDDLLPQLRYGSWLTELSALPPDAPEWDEAPIAAFVARLQRLAAERREARELGVEQLQARLDALLSALGSALHSFEEFERLSEWSAQHCPKDLTTAAGENIQHLYQATQDYSDLKDAPPRGGTRAEHRMWRQQLDQYEATIIDLGLWLQARFLPPNSAPAPPGVSVAAKTEPAAPFVNIQPDLNPAVAAGPQPQPPPAESGRPQASSEGDTVGTNPHSSDGDLRASMEYSLPSIDDVPPATTEGHADALIRAAARALETSDGAAWSNLLWLLSARGDLAGAYWLALSLKAQGQEPDAPPWLLAAVQYARWMQTPEDIYAEHLRTVLHETEAEGPGQELLRLAAALKLSVVAPGNVAPNILVTPAVCPALEPILSAVLRFQSVGVYPREELGGNASAQRNEEIANICQEVGERIREAPRVRFTYAPVSRVLIYLLNQRSELGRALALVADDRRDLVDEVQTTLGRLSDRASINHWIVSAERSSKLRSSLVGMARQALVRELEAIVHVAEPWCRLVQRERELSHVGRHVHEYVSKLRENFAQHYDRAWYTLHALDSDSPEPAIRLGAACLLQALNEMRDLLKLSGEAEPPVVTPWGWLTRGVQRAEDAVHRRLLWLPEIAVGSDGRPLQDELLRLAPTLAASLVEQRDLETVFTIWLEQDAYENIDLLLSEASGELRHDLQRRLRARLRGEQNRLQDHVAQLIEEIEQAFADEYISSERRVAYTAALGTASRSVEHNITKARGLLQGVRDELAQARRHRLSHLRTQWLALHNHMESQEIDHQTRARIVDTIEDTFALGEVRLTASHLNHLESMLSRPGPLDLSWLDAPKHRDYLNEFLLLLKKVSLGDEGGQAHNLDAQLLLRETGSSGIHRQGAVLLQSWQRLRGFTETGQQLSQALEGLFTALGFRAASKGQVIEIPFVQLKTRPRWAHVQARMSLGDLARPLAQFGSALRDQKSPLYDIVCLWDAIPLRELGDELSRLPLRNRSAIVCCFAALSLRTRRELRGLGQRLNLSLLFLDDTLITYLSQCDVEPLFPPLLYSAAPFSTLMPYYPFSAGGVPREVFFGREELRRSLLDEHSTCIIFGGRQMGKSALLVNARDHFHNPDRGHYAALIDIKVVGDFQNGHPPVHLWQDLFEMLQRMGLVEREVRYRSPEDVQKRIRGLVQKDRRRIIIMFDEADHFLMADAMRHFQVVEQLRTLMFETNRRFKVIFAGLHHVQRYAHIPNQPLAHFGTPQPIGPLEPAMARELVREPMEAIGYRFENDNDILRILSYTNYHPGLIQIFCAELVRQFQSGQGASGDPPYIIGKGMVESVYRQAQVRDAIRSRFDWTLALDMAYQAIVWCLVEAEQLVMRELAVEGKQSTGNQNDHLPAAGSTYDTLTVLRLVRQRLPRGFAEVNPDQLRSLLDELVGLGILIHSGGGHFRLSSPNIAHLFAEDTEQRLLALEDQPHLFHGPDFDSYYRPISADRRSYSPLTYGQERRIFSQDSGVTLVLGSDALGLSNLDAAIQQLAVSGEYYRVDHVLPVPQAVLKSGDMLRDWLRRTGEVLQRHQHVVYFGQPNVAPEHLEALIESAIAYCQQLQHEGRNFVNILFGLAPETIWTLLNSPSDPLQRWEQRGVTVTWLYLWTSQALYNCPGPANAAMTAKQRAALQAATGGWPLLLDEFHHALAQNQQLETYIHQINQALGEPASSLAVRFIEATGIAASPTTLALLRFIAREGDHGAIERDLVMPELIDDAQISNTEQCQLVIKYLLGLKCLHERENILIVDPIVRKVL